MPNRFKTAALIEKEMEALAKANEMAEGARREAARKKALLPLKLKAFEADEREAEAQKAEGQGGGGAQAPAPPSFANVSPERPDDGLRRDNQAALQNILSGPEASSSQTVSDSPGAATGGLPSRTLDRTTTNTSTQNLLGRHGDVLRLLFGADTATIPRTSTSTSTVQNPQFEQHLQNTAHSIGVTASRMASGDLRPDQFAPEVKRRLDGLTPQEQQRVMVQSRDTASALMAQQKEQERQSALELGSIYARDGIPGGGKLAVQGGSARTPEQVQQWVNDLSTAYKNSPKEQRAARIAESQETFARLRAEQAQWEHDAANPANPANIARKDKEGVFADNGATTDLDGKQLKDLEDKTFFKGDGSGKLVLDITEDSVAASHELVGARIARWEPANMPIPDRTTAFGLVGDSDRNTEGHWMSKQGGLQRLDPQDVYEWVLPLSGEQGYTKNGVPALDPSEVDDEVTEEKRKESIKNLTLAGYKVQIDTDGLFGPVGQVYIEPDERHPFPYELTQILNISRDAIAVGDFRGGFVESPKNLVPLEGRAARPGVQGPRITPGFAEGLREAELRVEQERRQKILSELSERFPVRGPGPSF